MIESCGVGDCSKVFDSRKSLLQHRRCHVKKHACGYPTCRRKNPPVRFSTKRDLDRHQQTHSRANEKHLCPYCHEDVSRLDNLKRHRDTLHKGGITRAASMGDEDAVNWILLNYPDVVNERDGGGTTALIQAAEGGHEKAAKVLLDNGAEIDFKCALTWKPGYRWNWIFGGGMTALAIAVSKGNFEVAQLLIRAGADIEARIGSYHAPLLAYAVGCCDGTGARFLANQGADMDSDALNGVMKFAWNVPGKLIALAASLPWEALRKTLVERSTKVFSDVLDACKFAMTSLDMATVRTLLSMPEVTAEIATSISNTILNCFCGVRSGILERHRKEFELDGTWVRLLLEHGADANLQIGGRTNLMLAVNNQRLDAVLGLIEFGADINAKAEGDWTALHTAVWSLSFNVDFSSFNQLSFNIVRILVENGADCQAVTETGNTPADLARLRQHRGGANVYMDLAIGLLNGA